MYVSAGNCFSLKTVKKTSISWLAWSCSGCNAFEDGMFFFVSLESESELKQLTKYRDLMMSFFKEIFKSDIRKMSILWIRMKK